MFENVKIETIDDMVEQVLDGKMFDDECDELEYRYGYVRGAMDMLKRIKTLIDGFGDLTESQETICHTILEWICKITYQGEPIVEINNGE